MSGGAIAGSREDLIWLAGLLEGEGTFDLHKKRYPRIRLGMTDRDVVGRAASLMRARIRMSIPLDATKTMFHTEISGARAAEIMRSLLPYMGARRSARIGEILGAARMRGATGLVKGARMPGPSLTRPPGFAAPLGELTRTDTN